MTKVVVSFKIDEEILKVLDEVCSRLNLNRSACIRLAIYQMILVDKVMTVKEVKL